MKVIYKYPLMVIDRQTIKLPTKEFKILSVQPSILDKREIFVWVELDKNEKREPHMVSILIKVTGREFKNENLEYIGTFQVPENTGVLVGHVYLEDERDPLEKQGLKPWI
jgi:hypothetical protein